MTSSRRIFVACLIVILAVGVLPPPQAVALPLPPGVNEAVSFFHFLGALNRRNRVYTEAKRTQADVDAYYETLRRALAADLVKGELVTAPSQKPVRSYVRMTQALAAEKRAATAQIEAEKNDARRNFNREVGTNLFDLLVASPGGQRLVKDVKSTIDELRKAALLVKAAADGASLEAALQALADRVTSSEQVGNIVRGLGGVLAQEIDGLLGGIIKKLTDASGAASGELDAALAQIGNLEGRLDEIAGEHDRVPFSIAGDGSPLSDVRLVKEEEAALNVAIDAIVKYGIIIGALSDMNKGERSAMRDRIRRTLLETRLADLGHAITLAQNVRCEHVTQGAYNEVAATLGQTPEVPREGSEVRYLVCYDNKTSEAIFAALIGPSKSDTTTTTIESGDDGGEEPGAEGTGSDGDPYAPLTYHIDVAPEKMAGTEQGFGSFYQIWIDATEEGEMAHFATPGLTGGTLDISFDFAAMTVSGSFDLIYDQVPKGDESVCAGSPEAFYGTARGAFVDLPIVPAPTSETPPADWALSDEDWYPRDEGDWYVGGGFPVDLAMSGIIVMSCATYDGETSYAEWPFDEAATVTAWTDSSISFYRNQGPDHVTRTSINLVVTTVDGGDANPNWRYSFWWSDEPDRQIPDPLEG